MTMGSVKKRVQTSRVQTSYLEAGDPAKQTVLLVHGNVSSNLFWDETVERLSSSFRVIAPDLRGYGETEAKEIDATRGVRDWSDDLRELLIELGIESKVHLVGWSLGGGVAMQYSIDHPESVASLTLINPISPFGFGGTKGEEGTPCHASYAGSGGGTANPVFVQLLQSADRTSDNPNSPRNVMNAFYFKPPFTVTPDREENFITSMLSTKVGDGLYPGTFQTCEEWPQVCPGTQGINNAISPQYFNVSGFSGIEPKPPVLWIRGADDSIVSDHSFFDFGFLGQQGFVPGWPGEETYPPQPMVKQIRFVLENYKNNGGTYEEYIVADAGHSPHIEKAEEVYEKIVHFLRDSES
ncbi:alpha/beta hydrolase [Brevibacillus sp. SYSU BS000544]|uniref:alpha/beta hydrolase n=1 Tax=Brevibacillus sp. SYSU BS000544 TaxID=3416443 RepID=UPI003CE4A624